MPDDPHKSKLRYDVQKPFLRGHVLCRQTIPAEQVRITSNDYTVRDGTFQFLRGIELLGKQGWNRNAVVLDVWKRNSNQGCELEGLCK